MAETVHLELTASKDGPILGDSTQTSLGRQGTIECVYFKSAVRTAREKGSGMATGRRSYEPIIIGKRIDRATPLLYKALCENQRITAKFMFYRPSPNGDGTTQQFYTIEIRNGRISHFLAEVPNCLDPVASSSPPIEEIGFTFEDITWTYKEGGITHTDSWVENQ
jgi:type VI secretion system secreted protein Hcp